MTQQKSRPALPALNEYWPYQAAVLGDLISRHTLMILREHGQLNLSQWRVLAAVFEKPGCSATQVVGVTPMDKGLVSRAVASLIKLELIKKIEDPSDRRKASLYAVSYTHLRAHETEADLVCRLLLEKKK